MTSRHSSEGGGRRGVAPWIIVTAVAVIVFALGTTAYLLIVGGKDDASTASCGSQVVLPVVTDPGAAKAISAAAAAFDATKPVARSACVSTTVSTLPGSQTAAALITNWSPTNSPNGAVAAPAMWVADSAAELTALEATDSALTAGRDTKPMATSRVVLAVRADDAAAVAAAGLTWLTLPGATGPNGSVVLPSGQHLMVALPDPTTNRGTSYALQSVVAARPGGTVDTAGVAAAAADLKAFAGTAQPDTGSSAPTQPATTEEALTQLGAGTGTFNAVPVVESDLVAFSATTPGLTGISPAGAAVGDTVYAVPLTAGWINPTMEDAAALFLAYLRGPGGDQAFIDTGFVVAGLGTGSSTESGAPTTSTSGPVGSGPAAQSAVLPDAGQEIAEALAAAVGATPTG